MIVRTTVSCHFVSRNELLTDDIHIHFILYTVFLRDRAKINEVKSIETNESKMTGVKCNISTGIITLVLFFSTSCLVAIPSLCGLISYYITFYAIHVKSSDYIDTCIINYITFS